MTRKPLDYVSNDPKGALPDYRLRLLAAGGDDPILEDGKLISGTRYRAAVADQRGQFEASHASLESGATRGKVLLEGF